MNLASALVVPALACSLEPHECSGQLLALYRLLEDSVSPQDKGNGQTAPPADDSADQGEQMQHNLIAPCEL